MNGQRIILTGATGAIGPHLIASLLSSDAVERIDVLMRPAGKPVADRLAKLRGMIAEIGIDAARLPIVNAIEGNIDDAHVANALNDCRNADIVIHAAADTRFRAPECDQMRTNVGGTKNILDWARSSSRLKRFVFVSTTCVAGMRTGRISESLDPVPPRFVNAYESSKWQAERLVAESGLPSTIVRLSTVIGSERSGKIARLGATHHALRWFYRGLIPMMPGTAATPIDLISSELAASCIARAALADDVPPVLHVSAGEHAIPLAELIDFSVDQFGEMSPAWRCGQIARPMIVDKNTFELFRESIHRSGDVLFRSVLDSITSFLPGLLHPKTYETTQAERLMGGPLRLQDWRLLLGRVIARCVIPAEIPVLRREVCDV